MRNHDKLYWKLGVLILETNQGLRKIGLNMPSSIPPHSVFTGVTFHIWSLSKIWRQPKLVFGMSIMYFVFRTEINVSELHWKPIAIANAKAVRALWISGLPVQSNRRDANSNANEAQISASCGQCFTLPVLIMKLFKLSWMDFGKGVIFWISCICLENP